MNDSTEYLYSLNCSIVYVLFGLFLFFFKEILVQDHFFSKYLVNHNSIFELDYLCLPPLMMIIDFISSMLRFQEREQE